MPQLDKLSFSTQYIWLTLFVAVIYLITIDFFATNAFTGLKLRSIIANFVNVKSNSSFDLHNQFMFSNISSFISKMSVLNIVSVRSIINRKNYIKRINNA